MLPLWIGIPVVQILFAVFPWDVNGWFGIGFVAYYVFATPLLFEVREVPYTLRLVLNQFKSQPTMPGVHSAIEHRLPVRSKCERSRVWLYTPTQSQLSATHVCVGLWHSSLDLTTAHPPSSLQAQPAVHLCRCSGHRGCWASGTASRRATHWAGAELVLHSARCCMGVSSHRTRSLPGELQ